MPGASGAKTALGAFCPGITQNSMRRLHSRFNFQTARLRLRFGAASQRSAAPILCGAGYAGLSLFPLECRGSGAPSGAPVFRLAASSCEGCGRLSALHGGDFCSPGPRFLVSVPVSLSGPRRQFASSACRALDRPETSGTVPVQQAPCGAVLVPPDRVPRPPGSKVTSLARGRRIPSRCPNVS